MSSLPELVAVILGLLVFEVINSLDNAVVNAHMLGTMSLLWRRRFLIFGIISSVFLVRFLLPLLILWISVPTLSPYDFFIAFTGGNQIAASAIEAHKPIILMFGAVFLIYLYFHWLFLEKKDSLFVERFIKEEHGVWFFAVAAVTLVLIMYLARENSLMMLAAAVGSATFFILYGLREKAETGKALSNQGNELPDISKFLYLEILDATFSFDGVIGAFAFTINLFLILIGSGIGAIVVRQLTIKGIDRVSKYRYLKNGALTSIGFLGLFMLGESLGLELPIYVPVIVTFLLVGVAFLKSRQIFVYAPEK